MSLPDSFWSKAKYSTCIEWTGALNSRGYGCYQVNGVTQLVHRLAYIDANGPIPLGLTIDHTCRNRRCVNVEHLEAVTGAENTRRAKQLQVGTACSHGHIMESHADIYVKPDGRRECVRCKADQRRRHREDDRQMAGSAAAIRAWAKAEGYLIGDIGRIPRHIKDAYLARQRAA